MKTTAIIFVAVGVLNFVAFAVHSIQIGGSAGNGAIRDGHCFVSDHGKETEVSETTYRWSLIHGRSLWISHPLAMIGMLLGMASDPSRNHSSKDGH